LYLYIVGGGNTAGGFVNWMPDLERKLNAAIAAISITPQTCTCAVYYWQDNKAWGIFSYSSKGNENLLREFERWAAEKFNSPPQYLRVYYLTKEENWGDRNRIENDEDLLEYLKIASNDKTSRIMVSSEDTSPTKAPAPAEDVSAITSGGSSRVRGTVQLHFSGCVRSRDNSKCLFCGLSEGLEAAHVFDVWRQESINPNGLRKLGLNGIYETKNGITLCKGCHCVFDALLCCIDVCAHGRGGQREMKILVAEAILHSETHKAKWTNLNGKSINFASEDFPTDALLNFRKNKFQEYAKKRRARAIEFPETCLNCGERLKDVSKLAKHMKTKRCIVSAIMATANLKNLSTPKK